VTVRVGLLESDHVRAGYLPIAGDYRDMFTAMVARADPDAEIVAYDVRNGVLPRQSDECDAWLCTGSSSSVYDQDPWIEGLAGFVRQVHADRVPFVGVCFGHQMLAHALGGRTERAVQGWGVGARSMEITSRRAWMAPPLSDATLLYSHQDQVTELPPDATVLGATGHCAVAMLAVGDSMVGIQAHPEFNAPYLRALLEDRVDRIGEEGTAEAIATLGAPTDEVPVARWLLRFLRERASAHNG
jgi:GMP synthase-like glutamine amidotransferase